jgi:HSP20 family protein
MGRNPRSNFLPRPFKEVGDLLNWPIPRYLRTFGVELSLQTAVDISETKESYLIKAEIPGIIKDDITINIDNNELILKIEKKQEKSEEDETFYLREIKYGTLQRKFKLPTNSNSENIEAEFENGILKITIPKKETEEKKTKKIEIK